MKNCSNSKCGYSIDGENLRFLDAQPNLVYMDKVYSYRKGKSCPLVIDLDTGNEDCGSFSIEIKTYSGSNSRNNDYDCNCNCDCGCGCSDACDVISFDQTPEFIVEKSYVEVSYFNTNPPGNVDPMIASFDGVTASDITYANGQYSINTADLDSQIQSSKCAAQGLPTKTFFLLRNAGPFMMRATYYLEGTVNGNGKTCCFKAKIFNAKNAPNTLLPRCSFSDFAIEDLALPCTTDGIAPDVNFQFGANVNMIAPKLTIDTCCGGLILKSGLAVMPSIQVEVIRKSLFSVNAREAILPCDGVREDDDQILCDFDRDTCRDGLRQDGCGCGQEDAAVDSCCDDQSNQSGYQAQKIECGRSDTDPAYQYMGANCCRW